MVQNLRTTCMRKPENLTLVACEAGKSETWRDFTQTSALFYQNHRGAQDPGPGTGVRGSDLSFRSCTHLWCHMTGSGSPAPEAADLKEVMKSGAVAAEINPVCLLAGKRRSTPTAAPGPPSPP